METNEEVVYIPKDVTTSLVTGERVRKDDLLMEACGTLDELNSFIGLLICDLPEPLIAYLHQIQRALFSIGATIAGAKDVAGFPKEQDIEELKRNIRSLQHELVPQKSFILPGGCRAASLAHVCRTVCRRAERCVVRLETYESVPYLNRLSTYFYFLALYLNKINDKKEIKW